MAGKEKTENKEDWTNQDITEEGEEKNNKANILSKIKITKPSSVGADGFEPPTLCL